MALSASTGDLSFHAFAAIIAANYKIIWDRVKEAQGALVKHQKPYHALRRPPHLFSYLLKCGCCGGGFSKISKDLYGCFNAKNKGVCDNHLTIRQDRLETTVLKAIQEHLMDEELCKIFCDEYRAI